MSLEDVSEVMKEFDDLVKKAGQTAEGIYNIRQNNRLLDSAEKQYQDQLALEREKLNYNRRNDAYNRALTEDDRNRLRGNDNFSMLQGQALKLANMLNKNKNLENAVVSKWGAF